MKRPATKADGSASERITKMIEGLWDWRGKTLAALRKQILATDKQIVEEWKWRGSPVWSREGILIVGNAHKGKVKLTFFHGAKLPDPKKLFNAGLGGGTWRAIDIYEGDKLDARAFKALIREAIAFNKAKKAEPRKKAKL